MRVESVLLAGATILATVLITPMTSNIQAQVMEPVEPGTENSVSNQGFQTQTLNPDELKFVLTVENGTIGGIYRICAGTTGEVIKNFGCKDLNAYTPEIDAGSGNLSHWWLISFEDEGNLRNTMLYGCIIGDTEKKVSCDMTSLPYLPAEEEMIIDWSRPSKTDMPPTFSPYFGDESNIGPQQFQQPQSERQNEGDRDNNNEEEEEENEE